MRKKIRELNDELNESGLPSVSINGEGILRFGGQGRRAFGTDSKVYYEQ